jgi:N-acetylmuramoyl-L-alanine amidase
MKLRKHTNKIIIHYTETVEHQDFDIDDVREWHTLRGFSDIGYHFLIKLDGTVQFGRQIDLVGAHCHGQNYDSIGVCYVGGKCTDGTLADTRTPEQMKSLETTIAFIRSVYGYIPCFGHNDYSEKVCPGYNVKHEHNN